MSCTTMVPEQAACSFRQCLVVRQCLVIKPSLLSRCRESTLGAMHEDMQTESATDPAEQMFWEEADRLITGQAKQVTRAIELCLAEDLWEPALVLMLMFIDACAWLARPTNRADVTFADFVAWTEKYLLPDSRLECTAAELYGARCGLLHSLTGESQLHRRKKIRKISWSRANGHDVYTLIQKRMHEKFLPVAVGIDHLFWALGKALNNFGEDFETDGELAKRVADRVHESYFTKMRRL
jgi:hypothetical protein